MVDQNASSLPGTLPSSSTGGQRVGQRVSIKVRRDVPPPWTHFIYSKQVNQKEIIMRLKKAYLYSCANLESNRGPTIVLPVAKKVPLGAFFTIGNYHYWVRGYERKERILGRRLII